MIFQQIAAEREEEEEEEQLPGPGGSSLDSPQFIMLIQVRRRDALWDAYKGLQVTSGLLAVLPVLQVEDFNVCAPKEKRFFRSGEARPLVAAAGAADCACPVGRRAMFPFLRCLLFLLPVPSSMLRQCVLLLSLVAFTLKVASPV